VSPEHPQTNTSYYDHSLYKRIVIRPSAKAIAPILRALGFSANGVGWLKLAVGLAGAALLASREAWIGFVGMLLLQINYLLDAADGDVARLAGATGRLSGEFIDKICDHLPKSAMYFMWGYGTYRLTGSEVPLFLGAFFAAWNIYPRFCGVEVLLERLDKAPQVYQKESFHKALAGAFVTSFQRGRADYWLTMLVHPAINLITMMFLIEMFVPTISYAGNIYYTRYILLIIYTIVGLVNFLRKGVRYYQLLDFEE
jgi:phosphatidylglycerophosphate synthase